MPLSKPIQNLIKIGIALLAVGFIIWKILRFDNLPEAFSLFVNQTRTAPIWLLAPVVIGLPLTWYTEILKWKLLIDKACPLPFREAATGVLTGLSMSLLTPNRVGELFTRVFVLPRDKRPEGIALSGINGLAQLSVILTFGLLGLWIYVHRSETGTSELPFLSTGLLVAAIALSGVFILAFFYTPWISWLLRLLRLEHRYPGIRQAIRSLSLAEKTRTWFLSLLKYTIHSAQFLFLLNYFGMQADPVYILSGILTIYLLLNFIPVISIGEAGVRGSVTLLIIGQNSPEDLGILAAALTLWILNIGIPALIGSYLMKKIKF